ncbi:MAG: GH3 auxin-responsive promoter family protein [Sphingobacteriaceae bacterium]|nr:GH3 auxin-responsive promoter family protein [Sphingobacteriaceae bacterium]
MKSDEMLLMLDYGIYYEFLELKYLKNNEYNRCIPLEDVQIGIDYAMIITSNASLWRYDFGRRCTIYKY